MKRKEVRRRLLWVGCLAALTGALLWGVLWPDGSSPAFARLTGQTLVIDPGHGGEDGGAVAADGSPESQLNLAIARSLDQLMGFYGVPAVMTRTEDVSIHDAGARTLREKKVSDLKNRVALIDSIPNATLISIHQNASPNPGHRGFQVFYGRQVSSRPLAQAVQQTLTAVLEPQKVRAVQSVSSSVYLMSHVSCRAILVECGFVSNPEEAGLLRQPAYQRKLAMTLAACYLTADSAWEGGSFV